MNNFEVALTKTLCPVCLKEQDGELIMNSSLTEKAAKQVKELHNQITGYGDLCEECKEAVGDGIYLIGVKDNTDRNNPYRSGHIFGIKKEAFEKIFNSLPKDQWTFCKEFVLKQIGLINE